MALSLANNARPGILGQIAPVGSLALPQNLQEEDQDAFAALLELADQEDPEDSCASQNVADARPLAPEDQSKVALQGSEGPSAQDPFAALLELADREDAEDSCASQSMTEARPSATGCQSKADLQGSEGAKGALCTEQLALESKERRHDRAQPEGTPQRPPKKRRSFTDSQENDSNAINIVQNSRPVQAQKKVAAFTSALARDRNAQAHSTRADQGSHNKAVMAPTQEKYSGLRMKNPVFPSVVLQERMSMLHFLRLSRAGDRVVAGEAGGPWATIAVLTEKSRPKQSSTGQAFSMWKVSDLAGVTVTLFLFGDAHQSLYRESEGSIMAICNAQVSAGGQGKDISMKVSEPSSVYKLGTSADFALCGARKKDGNSCRNAVNASVCRFCDYHVQGEYKRLTSNRGPLMTATVGARLSTHAKAAAKRQALPEGPRYVPPVPDMQQLDNAAAAFNSQGARHIASVFRREAAGGANASTAQPTLQPGKLKEAAKAEPRAYQSSAAQQKAKGLFASSVRGVGLQSSHGEPVPLAMPPSAGPQQAVRPLTSGQSRRGSSPQDYRVIQHGYEMHLRNALTGQQDSKQARTTHQGSTRGAHAAEARKETLVLLEDAEIDWDVGDIHKVQQRARDVPLIDRDEEEARGVPAAPAPVSPVRMPAPALSHASAALQLAGRAEGAEAMLRAIQIVQSRGGVEAMQAEQNATRKRGNTALAAARTSAATSASSARPDTTDHEAEQQAPSSIAAPKPALQPKSFFSAQPSRPSVSSAKPSSSAGAGSRERLAAKLKLAPKSSLGKKPAATGRNSTVVCQLGQSAFAAAFGDALKNVDLRQTNTRYKAVIEDEEHERLNMLLGTLERKDEAQQRMESVTHLQVTAWRCATCNCTNDKRHTTCQGHEGKSVTVTKRWWTCSGCNHRFTTLGVKYPTKRCPNPRCSAPESEFIKAGMASSKAKSTGGAGEPALACREDFKARGTEHGFALK